MKIENNNFQRRDGDLLLEFLRFATHPVHHVPTYYFRMIHSGNGEELGEINLRYASSLHVERYAGHIGFSVHPQHRGNGFAARSVALLLPVAKCLGLDGLWITCDPENIASRRSLERADAEFIEIVDVPADCIIRKAGHPQKCRYWIDLSDICA